ncbi:drug/metabolite transporter (DMT)-like permease [Actinomadura namibiensis]|uniref:Drug/metabolite transporter (DMT)-like permease n=1 Tax=Actinomadura namibiensis TaxID=182080 RepID=A0A7W3LLW3_ACTNM|nr:EamA family transporter [Actinomadura namibiensis]MBA8950555.1 drug/metabolite transporter (DMT)-like permease [Actinomadura namibiensis]
MVITLALAAAMTYGVADFLGGAAARHASALKALVWAVPAGMALILASALAVGGTPAAPALAWGAGAGLAGGAGLITFYRALAQGPMSVVAPVSALAASLLPIAVGVARGERLEPGVLAGVLLCLVAIVLVSMEENEEADAPAGRGPLANGPLMAGVSGVLFGIFFILLKQAGDGAGLWPLVGARLGNLAAVAAALLALALLRPGTAGPRLRGRLPIGLALLSGALDATANILYFLAVNAGMLSLAAVLTSLYPAITVLLARIAYSERLRTVQRLGLVVAAAGVTLVTVG